MTNQYAVSDSEDVQSTEGQMTEGEDTQEQGGSQEEQYQNFVRDVTQVVLAELAPRLDNNFRGTQAQVDRLATQMNRTMQELRDLGASKEDVAYVRSLLEESLSLTDEQRTALHDRQELERRRAQDQKKTGPAAEEKPQQRDVTAEQGIRFDNEILPDLEDYARLKGFTDQDLQATNWMGRLIAAGAPMECDYTPQGIKSYKSGMKRAMDKVAQDAAASRRQRTVAAAVTTAGGGRASDISGYQDALKKGGPLPDKAEIDRLTARYLNG